MAVRLLAVPRSLIAAAAVVYLAGSWTSRAEAQTPKADKALAAMTLEEKISMVHGGGTDPDRLGQAGYLPGVPRLGIPPLRLTDGPAGIRITAATTAMPAPIALAATFDTALAFAYGRVTGAEGRARNQDVQLAPMVNIVRVPNAGRNFETLGEDPLLAGSIVAAEIRGIQSQGLIATVKHFAANNQEAARQSVSANVDERTLHEIYLPGFESAVRAGVGSVMCSYNRVNTIYACENPALLTDVLRSQFGFTGWVMSDWGATHSTAAALTAGLDMEMPSGRYFGDSLAAAIRDGRVPMAALDAAVHRTLATMERFGLLDASPSPRPALDSVADAVVARSIAIAGAVLLRNEHDALPIRREDLQSIAVIGPGAAVPPTSGGGSGHVNGFHTESLLAALTRRAGAGAKISYASGVDADGSVVPAAALVPVSPMTTASAQMDANHTIVDNFGVPSRGSAASGHGLVRSALSAGAAGTPTTTGTVATAVVQVDSQIDFMGSRALPRGTSWTWTGTITAPAPGEYDLIVQTSGGRAQLQIDGGGGAGGRGGRGGPGGAGGRGAAGGRGGGGGGRGGPPPVGIVTTTQAMQFVAGQSHQIALTGTAADSTTALQIRLSWSSPESRKATFDAAVAAARGAHVAIVVGTSEGSEGSDRPTISLASFQDSLISAVSAANHRTAVVLFAGAPVLMPWVEASGAVLQMWFPGQEGADATASILLGEANPGGKLPETFPKAVTDEPTNDPARYPGVNGQEAYSEGILVGYRWYDAQKTEPLFPFGHGLSYTTFAYSDANVSKSPNGGYDVHVTIRNTGKMTGTEVAQVYLGAPPQPPVPMAPQQLVGFARVELAPGKQQAVVVHVGDRQLSYWSVARHAWEIASGARPLLVGSSSRDIRVRNLRIDVP